MLLSSRPARTVAFLIGWLLTAGQATAALPAIQDDAGMFQAETRNLVETVAERLRQQYQVDLRIETVSKYPPDIRKRLDELGSKQISEQYRLLAKWAEQQARSWGTDGIFIIIARRANPRSIHVVVGPETQARTFTASDAEGLRKLLVRNLDSGKKSYDEGLREALTFIERTVADNRHGGDWLWVTWAMAGCLISWMGLGMVRTRLVAPIQVHPAADGSLPGLLGGSVPAAAGFWLFASLFGSSAGPPARAERSNNAGGDQDPSGTDGGRVQAPSDGEPQSFGPSGGDT
jgi:hypothetical protein